MNKTNGDSTKETLLEQFLQDTARNLDTVLEMHDQLTKEGFKFFVTIYLNERAEPRFLFDRNVPKKLMDDFISLLEGKK